MIFERLLGRNPEAQLGINHTPLPPEFTLVTPHGAVPDSRRPMRNPLQERRGYVSPVSQIPPAPEYQLDSNTPPEFRVQTGVPAEYQTQYGPDPAFQLQGSNTPYELQVPGLAPSARNTPDQNRVTPGMDRQIQARLQAQADQFRIDGIALPAPRIDLQGGRTTVLPDADYANIYRQILTERQQPRNQTVQLNVRAPQQPQNAPPQPRGNGSIATFLRGRTPDQTQPQPPVNPDVLVAQEQLRLANERIAALTTQRDTFDTRLQRATTEVGTLQQQLRDVQARELVEVQARQAAESRITAAETRANQADQDKVNEVQRIETEKQPAIKVEKDRADAAELSRFNAQKALQGEIDRANTAETQVTTLQGQVSTLTTEKGQAITDKQTAEQLTAQANGTLVGELIEKQLLLREAEERTRLRGEVEASRANQIDLLRGRQEAEERATAADTRAQAAEARLQEVQTELESIRGEMDQLRITNGIQLQQIEAYTHSEEGTRATLNDIMSQITQELAEISTNETDPRIVKNRSLLTHYIDRLKIVIAGLNTPAEKELVETSLDDARRSYETYLRDSKNRDENRKRLVEAQQNYYHILWHDQSAEIFKDIAVLNLAGVHLNAQELNKGYDDTTQWQKETNMSKMPQALLMKVYGYTQQTEGQFAKPEVREAAIDLYTKLRNIVEEVSDCYVLDDRLVSYGNLDAANADIETILPAFKASLVNQDVPALQTLVYSNEVSYPQSPGVYKIGKVDKVGIVRKTTYAKDKSIQAVNATVTYADATGD